jgi:ubiquinone/menaquinone biosynthesis C-methylase UbiE
MDRLLELTSRAERSHFWFRGFRAFVEPLVRRAVHGVPTPRILDCGCGTGVNIDLLRKYGQVYGFDLTRNGLEFARDHGRGPVLRASIGAIPFQDQTFDVVTCFDVFQSLPDPVEHAAVREMWRLLKPGGRALLNVSALEILRGRHAALSGEVRRYTPGRLRLLLEQNGFEVERVTFVHAAVFPMILTVRLAQRWASGKNVAPGEFDITVPPAPINATLTALVHLEAAALRVTNMPIGSSVLCLARKVPRR